MYLGIRTDSPVAEMYLYKGEQKIAGKTWQADRELAKKLLGELEDFLQNEKLSFNDLTGLFVFQGPGSFTGLRIGLTVMNTLSYGMSIPIVGAQGEEWEVLAAERLRSGENDEIVLPFYGADAHITKPKK